MSIKVFYDNVDFRLKESRKTRKIIDKVIEKEGRISGDLLFIFTDDESLRKINLEFLEHDYFTDVISFNYSIPEKINGEVYISIDRVKENSVKYNVSLKDEVLRIMMHGVLHLLGINDESKEEKEEMRLKEDLFIEYFNSMWNEL